MRDAIALRPRLPRARAIRPLRRARVAGVSACVREAAVGSFRER
ncbi:hypothetical protein C7S16_2358 [Burkholderia thailandensis]|uniref:Uncharacterized protein n=1 Tax=Burkholderia thailandensis TaxID=57975 RepID=A0AAW9D000_BURTH|nr:hypothetical protein [Burkholderia thailandensis]MDW9254683.1 hypothetical protein [Burkholderia thailandensis]